MNKVKMIKEYSMKSFEEEINNNIESKNIIDIKYQLKEDSYKDYVYTAMIIYKE